MANIDKYLGPTPLIASDALAADRIMAPLTTCFSGELTANITGAPMGTARRGGQIRDVYLSYAASGKDDDDNLDISGEVFINGTSCLTTLPSIGHVSGEASQQKTTQNTGDTGIVQAVMDGANNTVSPGDLITCDITLNRTTPSGSEIHNLCIVVEFATAEAIS